MSIHRNPIWFYIVVCRWTSIRISCLWPSDEVRKSIDSARIVIAAARRYISIHPPRPHLHVTLSFSRFHFFTNQKGKKKLSDRMCSKCRRKIFLFAFDSIFYMTSSAWVRMGKVTWKINVWKCENFDAIEHRSVNRFQINTAEFYGSFMMTQNQSFFLLSRESGGNLMKFRRRHEVSHNEA